MPEPLLGRPLHAASAGVELFNDELERQGVPVERVDWRPPAAGSEGSLARLAPSAARIAEANDEALARLQSARPTVTGIGRAGDLVDAMDERTFLHAGPPIEWPDMSGPLRGAIIGAALYEGLADSPEAAADAAARGEYDFVPCHERGAVGPMAGVVSHSMPMWIVTNEPGGNRALCT